MLTRIKFLRLVLEFRKRGLRLRMMNQHEGEGDDIYRILEHDKTVVISAKGDEQYEFAFFPNYLMVFNYIKLDTPLSAIKPIVNLARQLRFHLVEMRELGYARGRTKGDWVEVFDYATNRPTKVRFVLDNTLR
jgi:hypothetical protein